MRVLVLGGSGFIGSHVVDGLRAEPDVEVWSMDRSPERFRHPLPDMNLFKHEFGNRGAQEDILGQGVDTVIHLVSSTIPATSNKDPIFDIQSNLIETVAFLDLAVKYKVKRIVFVSSGGTIYGEQEAQPIPESAALWPICSYGIVKAAVEQYLYMYHRLYGLEAVSLRLANPYGPRQDPTKPLGAISVFLYRCLRGLPIEVWGDGNVYRDYVYIDDVKKAIMACVKSELSFGCYNIGSGITSSLNDIIRSMREIGLDPQVKYSEPREYDIKSVALDCGRAQRELGWKADIPLARGIERTHIWMKSMIEGGEIE